MTNGKKVNLKCNWPMGIHMFVHVTECLITLVHNEVWLVVITWKKKQQWFLQWDSECPCNCKILCSWPSETVMHCVLNGGQHCAIPMCCLFQNIEKVFPGKSQIMWLLCSVGVNWPISSTPRVWSAVPQVGSLTIFFLCLFLQVQTTATSDWLECPEGEMLVNLLQDLSMSNRCILLALTYLCLFLCQLNSFGDKFNYSIT